jgi:hypothetical protein
VSKKRANPKQPPAKRRIRPRPGDVIAIPLSARQFAFGRIHSNCGLAVFDFVSRSLPAVEAVMTKRVLFHCLFFSTAVKSGEWSIIGHAAFENDEAAWGPPMWHLDDLSGKFSIRYKGRETRATAAKIRGLDEEIMWYPAGLIGEIKLRRRMMVARAR